MMSNETSELADSWSALLQHVIEEGRDTPKCQVERAVGPILGAFIGPLMSAALRSTVILVAAEFPLLKKRFANEGVAVLGLESTNIDWLMYDVTNRQLILLELKTEAGSLSGSQLKIYQAVAEIERPWDTLSGDLIDIAGKSDNAKYRRYRQRISDRLQGLDGIGEATVRIVYLAPDACRSSLQVLTDKAHFVSFGNLRDAMRETPDLRSDPMVVKLCEALVALDASIDAAEGGSSEEAPAGRGRNYQSSVSFDQMLDMCRKDPTIEVGFSGGESALKRAPLEKLRDRDFKWDWSAGDARALGGKNSANWVPGDKFATIVEMIVASRRRSDDDRRLVLQKIDAALQAHPDRRLGELLAAAISGSAQGIESIDDIELVEGLSSINLP